MTTVVIAYATTEGHTRTIARAVADHLTRRRIETRLIDCAEHPAPEVLDGADAVILTGSVHMARFQASLLRFITRNRARLEALPTAFICVSLAAQSEDDGGEDELARYRDSLIQATHWTPGRYHDAAGALKYAEYDFFKRWIMRRIAREQGLPTTGGDHVFTDWAALTRFADGVVDALAPAS